MGYPYKFPVPPRPAEYSEKGSGKNDDPENQKFWEMLSFEYGVAIAHMNSQRWVMFTWSRYLKIPARIAEKLMRSHSQQNNDWQWKIDGRGRTIPLWAGSHCYVPYALLNSPRPMHIWATIIGLSQFLGERGERGLWHEVWSRTYWGGGSS